MSGVKYDDGKVPAYQGTLGLFPRAMEALATVAAHGADKYSWTNWRDVSDGRTRYLNAMVRHLIAEGKGEVLDLDSGLPTAWHTLFNDIARIELSLIEQEEEEAKRDWVKQVQRETETCPATQTGRSKDSQPEPYRPGCCNDKVSPTDYRRQEEVWR